jgi:serralysin
MRMCRAIWGSALLASLALVGCAADDQGPLDWDDYQQAIYQEPDTGVYIVNGDEPADTLEEVADVYRMYRDQYEDDGIGHSEAPLTINVVGGVWDRWSPSAALNITYCISNKGFNAARKAAVVAALDSATADWEGSANVNFVYVPGEDGRCNNRNTSVVFDVDSVCRGQYLARSFFPSDSRRNRELLIDCTSFGTIAPWTLTGIMRHELGHTIGFRHEHVVAPGNPCPEGGSWEQLTPYDSSSVMHYPQCNGTQTGDLVLTSDDRAGARIAYP